MKSFQPVTPAPFREGSAAWHFSPAVIAGGQLHISGQIGLDPSDMSVPADLESQLRHIFSAFELILAEAGASAADIFSMTSYHVGDMQAQLPAFIAARSEFLGGPAPAWTAIGVSGLAMPGLLIEVSAIATMN